MRNRKDKSILDGIDLKECPIPAYRIKKLDSREREILKIYLSFSPCEKARFFWDISSFYEEICSREDLKIQTKKK